MENLDRPIFITARFRTGSTMLWYLFRQLKDFKSYYEPCHDNLIEHVHGATPVQESHEGVDSYWDEYKPLMDRLPALHKNDFGICRLLLESSEEWPELEIYLRFLLQRSQPLRPVLQFNRMDFRLPWLKKRFPEAVIVHLFRDPREQWLSIVRDLPEESIADPDGNTNYDLVAWAVGLSKSFPFLLGSHIRHSYERHYLIWQLSHLMGTACADLSLSYDKDFQEDLGSGLEKLLTVIGEDLDAVSRLAPNVVRRSRPAPSGTPSIAEFERMERWCDQLLTRLGLSGRFGRVPLRDIRHDFESEWSPFDEPAHEEAGRLGCLMFSRLRSHYLDIVTSMRHLGQNARNVEKALAESERELREIRRP